MSISCFPQLAHADWQVRYPLWVYSAKWMCVFRQYWCIVWSLIKDFSAPITEVGAGWMTCQLICFTSDIRLTGWITRNLLKAGVLLSNVDLHFENNSTKKKTSSILLKKKVGPLHKIKNKLLICFSIYSVWNSTKYKDNRFNVVSQQLGNITECFQNACLEHSTVNRVIGNWW